MIGVSHGPTSSVPQASSHSGLKLRLTLTRRPGVGQNQPLFNECGPVRERGGKRGGMLRFWNVSCSFSPPVFVFSCGVFVITSVFLSPALSHSLYLSLILCLAFPLTQ